MNEEFPIYPFGDKLFVSRLENREKVGSIFIPNQAKEKPQFGKVVAVGPGVEDVEVDSVILYGKYAGTEINVLGKDYLLLREDEVLGLVSEAVIEELLAEGV